MNRRYGVTATIMAALLLLLVPACTMDYWPSIISLQTQATWAAPGGSLRVTCNAVDSGGGELTYQWSASGGSITGTGAAVDWTAPQVVGMYDLTVMVTNPQGRQTTESLALIVSNGPPPVMESMVITARDHEYLKQTATGYMTARSFEYDIECVASATSGDLIYQWSSTGGGISGDGPAVLWTAPDQDGRVTVAVKAIDSAGNWVSKSLILDVVDCESCVVW